MGIKKPQMVRGGVDVPDADHRIVAITVHAGRGGSLSGRFKAYKDTATADDEGESLGDVVVVDIPRKDMKPKMKAAIKTLLEALEDEAVKAGKLSGGTVVRSAS